MFYEIKGLLVFTLILVIICCAVYLIDKTMKIIDKSMKRLVKDMMEKIIVNIKESLEEIEKEGGFESLKKFEEMIEKLED